jgi:eukaryotic-like serine/threonine-protein kinase
MTETPSLVGSLLKEAYQVTRLIGQGGMGAVYEAMQTSLGKRVAIKVMDRSLATNPEALARFRREIQVTAQLAHPNIIQVTDFGTAPTGEPYLVMEFLDGEDLDQRLQRVTRLPIAVTVHIVKQLASALAVTHAEGIVHRDLKPANVFLIRIPGQTDFVKVVDFGISKVLKASTTKLTRAQMIVGTPEYMAPEQAAGKVDEIDHRSDQWSLACIAWHMLVGQQPFVGPDVNAILHQVMNGEPPSLGPGLAERLPAPIETVLRRALSKRQQDRFPTITAFSRAFEAACLPWMAHDSRGSGAAARESKPPSRRRPYWILVVLAAVTVGAGAAAFSRSGLLQTVTSAMAPTPAASPGPDVVPLPHAKSVGGARLDRHRPLH